MESITTKEATLYTFIQNLKINSKFSYEYKNGKVELSIQDKTTDFDIPNNSEIFIRLLNEKFLRALNRADFSLISFSTLPKTYSMKYSNEIADCTLALDEQNNLTEQSKKILDSIVDKEFATWKQTFHVISSSDFTQFSVYYDDKKMIIDSIVFEHIKDKLQNNEKSYNNLFDVNPFGRMIK